MDYKQTLNLPQTGFPMKADLPNREPQWLERWQKERLYERIVEKRKDAPPYLLHDGPPFANGDVHIGTALNKILKDIIVKHRTMTGHRASYVPGWDCHGLPIEYKVLKEFKGAGGDKTPSAIRAACAAYAHKYINLQREQFKRLGVLGRWDDPYLTMNPAYEAEVLRVLADLVEKGFVYRGKKPVFWCTSCRTALAEAEVEYHDHVSPSIFVKFPFREPKLPELAGASAVIWTTTPWTLPANLAIAAHPDFSYGLYDAAGQKVLIGTALWEKCAAVFGADPTAKPLKTFSGRELAGLKARHPFIERDSLLVLAKYVTADSGTGLVHTAPGHGLEDYQSGLEAGLEVYSPLDNDGAFVADSWMPPELTGKSVREVNGRSEANEAVLALLKKKGALLGAVQPYSHSYPFCWRSKDPVIFRAVPQWFIAMDHEEFRVRMLKACDRVEWVPDWGKNRMVGFLQTRPDWCISRQRTWGVPIPAFASGSDQDVKLDAALIRRFADWAEKEGAGVWFEHSASELASRLGVPPTADLVKSADTLDVWMESGSSHRAVLEKDKHLGAPADLYLEGSDQHRGWFQTSLSTSVATRDRAPFKAVLTHGFIVDVDGKKISKSGSYEKPKDSGAFVQRYGADILRLWVASQNFTNDIPLSEEILSHVGETYRRFRNTFRILLGNLHDYPVGAGEPAPLLSRQAPPIDRYILSRLVAVGETVDDAYRQFEFHRVYHTLNAFCTVELSSLYIDILKDRMYTFAPVREERKAAQAVMAEVLRRLALWLAPILPYTCEEVWDEYQKLAGAQLGSVHLQDFPAADPKWRDAGLEAQFEELRKWRDVASVELENARRDKKIGKSLEAKLVLKGRQVAELEKLGWDPAWLEEFFIVSNLALNRNGTDEDRQAFVELAPGEKCPRCWRVTTTVGRDASHPEVCERCAAMLEGSGGLK
ncbi:MAG: isoleucine--tRNA ligase [Verrucomicrobiae bacterium]|nr:isoleucine--tRNA ligase [Verrucomicrobiae bacterium]